MLTNCDNSYFEFLIWRTQSVSRRNYDSLLLHLNWQQIKGKVTLLTDQESERSSFISLSYYYEGVIMEHIMFVNQWWIILTF